MGNNNADHSKCCHRVLSMIGISVLPREAISVCQFGHFLWEKDEFGWKWTLFVPFLFHWSQDGTFFWLFFQFEMTFANIPGLWNKSVCAHHLIILHHSQGTNVHIKNKTEQYSLNASDYSESSHLALFSPYESIWLICPTPFLYKSVFFFFFLKDVFPMADTAGIKEHWGRDLT